ncbi:MAG: transposase, partial [Proteobacteria bacterium]|nr:transposase [Pseudomonadota bacterium]
MSDHHFWLSDAQFARLQPLLPNKPRGVPRVDDRRVISGIIHVIRHGLRWRDAPSRYGPHKTLYNRFFRW